MTVYSGVDFYLVQKMTQADLEARDRKAALLAELGRASANRTSWRTRVANLLGGAVNQTPDSDRLKPSSTAI